MSTWHQDTGNSFRSPDFVPAQLEMLTAEHKTLLCRIPLIQDVQATWLLLVHCAAARANCVPEWWKQGLPNLSVGGTMLGCGSVCAQFYRSHQIKEKCLAQLRCRWFWEVLGCDPRGVSWASWAGALHVIHNRHPEVAAQMVTALDDEPESRCALRRELGGMWRV